MKRSALFLFALVATPALASAQIGFRLSAGLAVPQGDFSQLFGNGYHLQASLNIAPPASPLGLRVDGTYDHFDLAALVNPGGSTPTGSAKVTGMSADAVYGLGGLIVGPYVLGGVGYYQTDITYNATSTSHRNPGFNAGAGFKLGVGDLGVSVEARYFYINGNNGSNNTTFIPVTFGISF